MKLHADPIARSLAPCVTIAISWFGQQSQVINKADACDKASQTMLKGRTWGFRDGGHIIWKIEQGLCTSFLTIVIVSATALEDVGAGSSKDKHWVQE